MRCSSMHSIVLFPGQSTSQAAARNPIQFAGKSAGAPGKNLAANKLQRAGGKNKAYLPWSGRVFFLGSKGSAAAPVAAFETTSSISFSTTAPLFFTALLARSILYFVASSYVFFFFVHNQLKRHWHHEKSPELT